MARLNKFASVNLNDSYGKPDRAGSANTNSSSSSSGSGKPRISSPGGMLVLSRPGRSQPPSPKPGASQARLGIPNPVNLPSLKRENSAGDPLPASPPHTGWTKGESPPLPGWTKGESPNETSYLQQKAVLSRSLDTVGETLKTMASGGKPEVYAPPALRAMQTATTTPRPPPPTPPLEKPSAVIRGEEFPTLQAAVARPPTPPQHPRQRDLQQKQREKHQESKEQQLRLQQLSQTQVQKEIQGDSFQAGGGNAQSQPSLSLRPLGKQQVSQKVNVEASGLGPLLHSSTASNRCGMQGPISYADGSLSMSSPIGVLNQGDTALPRSPPVPTQSGIGKADDLREAGHSFRPQYRNSLPSNQGSSNVDTRQASFSTGFESSWFSSSRRDLTPPSRNGDHPKFAGDIRTSTLEDSGRISSDFRSASFGRESYYGKDTSFLREGNSGGISREDANVQPEGVSREIPAGRFDSRSSALVHDGVPRIEGFHSQRSFGREIYNRDPRDLSSRMVRENIDVFQRDIKDSRENYSRDIGDAYERDVREAYHRDSRNVYTRDVREVYNQEAPINKHVGYSSSSVNNGDNLWRGSASYSESPHGRGGIHSPGITPSYNPGPEHDTHHGRRYGLQGAGDQYFTREGRSNPDSRASRGMYVESTAPYGSPETAGSRRVRSPALGNGSFDPVKEVHEIRLETPQKSFDENRQIKYEDKAVDTKVLAGNDLYGSIVSVQRPYLKRESSQGYVTRISHINTIKNVDDGKSSREDLKRQSVLEEERRKEAAKSKLLELEERIARRVTEEGRNDEIGSDSKDHVEETAPKQREVEQMLGNFRFESNNMGAQLPDQDIEIEEDFNSKLARPPSASLTSSWNYKSSSEGLIAQEQDSRFVSESELNEDRKVVRSRSPGSWRKDVGAGPTSKLFSSPYVESGFRRPSDGGTYKLF